jgi:FkbM family methyltransferase
MKEYILRKIKRFVLKATGKVNHLRKGVNCKHIWYGNTYGGFYVNPDLLNENSVIYSFGIGEDLSFDKAIIKKHHCHVYGFDPTPKAIQWLKTQKSPETFHFYDFGIGSESGYMDFYLPKNPEHVSGSLVVQNNIDVKEKVTVKMKALKDIMIELGHNHIDVLKMDIEGAEYEVIENIISDNISVSQILIEFHERFFENGKRKTELITGKLKDKAYEIFAVSDSYEEVSFIKTTSLP